jgi:hypothetical protein
MRIYENEVSKTDTNPNTIVVDNWVLSKVEPG